MTTTVACGSQKMTNKRTPLEFLVPPEGAMKRHHASFKLGCRRGDFIGPAKKLKRFTFPAILIASLAKRAQNPSNLQ